MGNCRFWWVYYRFFGANWANSNTTETLLCIRVNINRSRYGSLKHIREKLAKRVFLNTSVKLVHSRVPTASQYRPQSLKGNGFSCKVLSPCPGTLSENLWHLGCRPHQRNVHHRPKSPQELLEPCWPAIEILSGLMTMDDGQWWLIMVINGFHQWLMVNSG